MSLELLYNCERANIRRPEDAVLCSIHCSLIANGYKCIGSGEVIPIDNIRKSDMLPAGWNNGDDNYSLIYQSSDSVDSSILLLKIITFDGLMLVHLLRPSDEKAVASEIKASDFTTADLSSYDSAFQNREELERRLKVELLEPFQRKNVRATADRTDPPSFASRERQPETNPIYRPAQPEWEPSQDPFSIGRSDLDPFHGGLGGGGMIFDPLHAQRGTHPMYGSGSSGIGGPQLPRGAIVPGARFDPFGPPDLDFSGNTRPSGSRSSGPDPDHLPPPGYDDMFM